MANTGGSGPPISRMERRWTADKVVTFFLDRDEGLKLDHVTDDSAAIDRAYDDQSSRREKELHAPEQAKRETADRWFNNANDIRNAKKRRELLDIVFTEFESKANIALDVESGKGQLDYTNHTRKRLTKLIETACKTDAKLTAEFLQRYEMAHNLEIGGKLGSAEPVTDFKTVAGLNKIELSWVVPSVSDSIEIVREEQAASSGPPKRETFTVSGCQFVDRTVTPGKAYIYRVINKNGQFESPPATSRAICLGEVNIVKNNWERGRIALGWSRPSPQASVIILRSLNAPPKFDVRDGRVSPRDGTTMRVAGAVDHWEESDVEEGRSYHYHVICNFGNGQITQGVPFHVDIPKPVPHVASVACTYSSDGVTLDWPAIPGELPVEYVVVRKEGAVAPAAVDDGVTIETTAATKIIDRTVTNGHCYTYAVFSKIADRLSRHGTASQPVNTVDNVTNLQAEAGDGVVHLKWTVPEGVHRIIVRRGETPPRDYKDGESVSLTTGQGNVSDETVTNGQRYHYLVCAEYSAGRTSPVVTDGVRISAEPHERPPVIEGFRVEPQDDVIHCSWNRPGIGDVVLIRSKTPPPYKPGQTLRTADIDVPGDNLRIHVNKDRATAVDTMPDLKMPFYSAFAVGGDTAVASETKQCAILPDVSGLSAKRSADGVTLRWRWPKHCTSVVVARRLATPPNGPSDPDAVTATCTLAKYKEFGDKYVDRIDTAEGELFYVIYAQYHIHKKRIAAPGTRSDCRGRMRWGNQMVLAYRLAAGKKRGTLHLEWDCKHEFPGYNGFALWAGEEVVPDRRGNGIELFRWVPEQQSNKSTRRASVSLQPVIDEGWNTLYCKAFHLDANQANDVAIHHPNTCTVYFVSGKPDPGTMRQPVRPFKTSVPENVVCYSCFGEFPLKKLEFLSRDGTEVHRAKWSWLQRSSRRAPKRPTDSKGRVCPFKQCPLCKSLLPISAGEQESRIIGLVGARTSGKTTYIASLVNRLEGEAGRDVQASLTTVTDDTRERYQREFYEPLYGDGMTLPMSVGEQPPLVYDFELNGRLWNERSNRSVTLALYDTAGESLEDEERARSTARYLEKASGVIFLVDPVQTQKVRDQFPDEVIQTEGPLGRTSDPYVILDVVTKILAENGVMTSDEQWNVPVAIVLTKCDLLRDYQIFEPNRLWGSEKRHRAGYDTALHDDISGMVGESLQRWSPAAYATAARKFGRYAFFGVSSTGCAPNPQTQRYPFIAPWRVEDPLLWILSEIGAVPRR